MRVQLRPYEDRDLWLLRRLLGDPAMTVHLGGPETNEALVARHERYLASDGTTEELFTVLAGPDQIAAGWVGYWAAFWRGEDVWECGWHVLPEFQGRGVATAAVHTVLDRVRERGTRRAIYAFPSVDNVASNALCRTLGFHLIGQTEVEYPKGSMMRSNEWRMDLR